jgi:hypothetical protein
MAHFFVDFSAGSNGTGTAASPWNVFTSTQSASVSSGDSVWFRRYLMAGDTKFIAWKSGSSSASRINYIGWPIAGDTNYAAREETLKATWDGDSAQYAYQRKIAVGSSNPAALLVSFINVYRFYIYDDYTAVDSVRLALSTLNASYIRMENCYTYCTYLPDSTAAGTWYAGSLYIEGSTGIEVVNSTIDGSGSGSVSRCNTLKIKNSTVTFSGCAFKYGYAAGGAPVVSYLDDYKSSYINLSTVNFLNCSFVFQQTSGNITSSYSATIHYAYQHFVNSVTTISGCTIAINNVTNQTSFLMPSNIPISSFRVSGGTFTLQNSSATNIQSKMNFLSLQNMAVVSLDTVSWTITNSTSCSFIEIKSAITSLSLSNISGSVPTDGNGEIANENYFIVFIGWDRVTGSANITMNNVVGTLGYILDATRPGGATTYQSIVITGSTAPVLANNTVYVTSVGSLNLSDCSVGGFKFFQKTYASSDYIQGTSQTQVRLRLRKCSFAKTPLQIQATNNQYFWASIYSCVGAGTDILNANGNTVYSLDLTTVRNRGFTGTGTLLDQPWISANSILNDYNNGTAQYLSYELTYETSTVARTSGAGYSVKIIKKLDDNLPVYYPNIGEDATWIYIPVAGNYTVTAYIIYTSSSGSLTTADLKLGIDIMGAYSQENTSSALSGDSSSWPGVTGTAVKLVSSITTVKEQYCPVKLIINKRIPGLIIYFDPKVDVVVV